MNDTARRDCRGDF